MHFSSTLRAALPIGYRAYHHTALYEQLPRVPWRIEHPRSNACVQTVVDLATAFWAPAAVIAFPSALSQWLGPRKISLECENALDRTQETTRALAIKAGIHCPKLMVRVLTNHGAGSSYPAASGSAFHQPSIHIPPQWLLKPDDIPPRLSLTQLSSCSDPLIVDQWIKSFSFWLTEQFIQDKKPASQLEADLYTEHLKLWLKAFLDQNLYQAVFNFMIGHELGHIYHADQPKRALIKLCLQMLTFPMFPFTSQAANVFTRHCERRADLFSVNKLGERNAALWFFQELQNIRQPIVEKYPEIEEMEKLRLLNYLNQTHPTLAERIDYLRNCSHFTQP
jgi:hypothetical protein